MDYNPVIFFTWHNSSKIHMLVKVGDRYNFDGSYVYYSLPALNQLVREHKIIIQP